MQYDKTFKEEAVRLSDGIGIKNAATQPGISYNTLSTWCRRRKQYGLNAFPGSGYRTLPKDRKDQRIRDLEKENTELKRSNGILQETPGFFTARRKK